MRRSRRRRARKGANAGKFATLGFVLLIASLVAPSPRDRSAVSSSPPDDSAARTVVRSLDNLDAALRALEATPDILHFRTARRAYKHIEGALEFYAPGAAAALNGRRQELDDDDAPAPLHPDAQGFPALERMLFAARTDTTKPMPRLVSDMRAALARVRPTFALLRITDAQLFELARQEMARVSTLGIAGFDAPGTDGGIVESADALDGVRTLVDSVGPRRWPRAAVHLSRLDSALLRAARALRDAPDFGSFDRLAFIVNAANPAARALQDLWRAAGSPAVMLPRPWRRESATVFDRSAFDPRAYGPVATRMDPAAVRLGGRLFSDPHLSGPGTRSCASCHRPDHAFTDGLPRAPSIDGHSAVTRNTPTLINAALQPAQFYDERAVTLEDQIVEVLRSPAEMASSIALAVTHVRSDSSYARDFGSVFGFAAESTVTPLRLRVALAAYVRSLVALDSRFDRAVGGDTEQLTATERRGFDLFMGKARCGTCHFAPLFGGTTPPLFVNSDVEVIGVPVTARQLALIDTDLGAMRIDHLSRHAHAFKTPSLRNVALSAPYMHNGSFATLDDVLRFYDRGGGIGSGAHVPNQTLDPRALHLTAAERAAIIAFMGTLTDTSGTRSNVR